MCVYLCLSQVTATSLQPDVVEQLRQADHIVSTILVKHDLNRSLSQVPVVLFPVGFGEKGKRAIAIRTFITNDFMTGGCIDLSIRKQFTSHQMDSRNELRRIFL